jgi:hypothetical protein
MKILLVLAAVGFSTAALAQSPSVGGRPLAHVSQKNQSAASSWGQSEAQNCGPATVYRRMIWHPTETQPLTERETVAMCDYSTREFESLPLESSLHGPGRGAWIVSLNLTKEERRGKALTLSGILRCVPFRSRECSCRLR